jgi:acetylornithine/succinyldiaminopimelate/putrescine aminotransferase
MLRSLFFNHIAQTSEAPMGLEIQKAFGSYIYDDQGKAYLDFIAGISVSNVGHGNPDVQKAICEQAGLHLHTLVYGEHIQSAQVLLAKAITNTLPNPIDQIFFVNSGSEAVEGAMKLAKRATNRFEIIGCDKAYHGSSHGALSLNGDEYFKRNFRPLLPGIRQIKFGDFEDLDRITKKTAAVVIETVQGEAGVKSASVAYWQSLKKRCEKTGALLILDEIQTGFGRTGSFWGFEQFGIVPDVVLMAKGMGSGMPLGGFAARKELMEQLTKFPVLGHISTFGGHPVSCAAALAGMRFLLKENLMDLVKEKENFLKGSLQHPKVIEIRSVGLLMAVELGSFERVQSVISHCLKEGLMTDWFLHCNTALRIAPPLTISFPELEIACQILQQAFEQIN